MTKVHFVHPEHGVVGMVMNFPFKKHQIGQVVKGQPQAKRFVGRVGECRIVDVGEVQYFSSSQVSRQDVIVSFERAFWEDLEKKIGQQRALEAHAKSGKALDDFVSKLSEKPIKPPFPGSKFLKGLFG